ncbi:MAG: cytochrome c biogenesis protein CcdA [Candidatus Rokubacteria bacterium]|nr:cytochrome c biogenesis protein CcdA [Candidatus Rokubacteria bacterium]
MTEVTLTSLVFLPLGLGLLGFIEPCSIGSTLIVVKHLEGKSAASKLAQVGVFAGTRAVFIGLLGMLAVVLGTAFLGVQQGAWVVLGAVYVLLGLLYVVGKAEMLMVPLGPSLARLSDLPASAGLGVLFGFNIPACAAPLLLALLSTAAAHGAAGATLASGFVSLALFGLALSLPLVAAVLFEPARRAIDWLAGLSRRLPLWTGMLLIALGSWSIWLALSAPVKA